MGNPKRRFYKHSKPVVGRLSHRRSTLTHTPLLRELLQAMRDNADDDAALHVFGGAEPFGRDVWEAARKRLQAQPAPNKAPAFDWQLCRSTCATFSCNAPGVFGEAAYFVSAKRLGRSVTVSEKHYAGLFTGIPREARTLEAAMGIEAQIEAVISSVPAR